MNRAMRMSLAVMLSLAVAACEDGNTAQSSGGTNASGEMASIKIGLTYLEQQTLSSGEPLACKVAFEVTNEGAERADFVYAQFSLVNTAGEIIADESVGINNLMPGKSQSPWTTSSVPCADVAAVKNVSASNATFTVSEATKLPIES